MDSGRLTLGQAAFLVLSVSSNRVNGLESNDIASSSSFDITCEDTDKPKLVTRFTPSFSYPSKTPQLKDIILPLKEKVPDKHYLLETDDEGILFDDDLLFDGSLSEEEIIPDDNDKNESTASIHYEDINDKPIVSKKTLLSFARMIFTLHKPRNYRHDYMFVTPDMQYSIITSHLNIGSISVSKLSSIITKDDFISFMYIYKGAKGRWLYVLKEPHRDVLASEINQR